MAAASLMKIDFGMPPPIAHAMPASFALNLVSLHQEVVLTAGSGYPACSL
jgi:hypothetical protein